MPSVPPKVSAYPRKPAGKRPKRGRSPDGPAITNTGTGGYSIDETIAGESILLFAGIPGLERVKVFREDERTKKPVFHGNLSVDETTVDRVTELFGGGKYALKATTRDASGSEVYAKGITIVVPGVYKNVFGALPGVGPSSPGGNNLPPSQAIVSQLPAQADLRSLMESAMMTRMLDMVNKTPVAAPTDWAGIIAAGATLIKVLPELMKKDNSGETLLAQAVKELRSDLAALKDRPSPQASSMKEVLDVVKGLADVREAMSTTGGEAAEPEGNQLLSIASRVMDMLAQRSGAAMPSSDPAIAGHIAPPPATNVPPWQSLLQEYGAQLVGAAQRDVEPEIAAPMLIRYLPETAKGTLRELVAANNCAEVVVQVVPAMANHPMWLAAFIEELRGEMFGDAGDDAEGDDKKT